MFGIRHFQHCQGERVWERLMLSEEISKVDFPEIADRLPIDKEGSRQNRYYRVNQKKFTHNTW